MRHFCRRRRTQKSQQGKRPNYGTIRGMKTLVLRVAVLLLAWPVLEFCRRSAYWGRRKWSERELRAAFGESQKVMDALTLLAKFYQVPIGFLRPDDTFTKEGRLWKYDTWLFGDGQEALNDFVSEHGLHGEHPDWTIMDFVKWYCEVVGSTQ